MGHQVWEFHSDVVSHSEDDFFLEQNDRDDDILCRCYGRGKNLSDIEMPRLPGCQQYQKIDTCPLSVIEKALQDEYAYKSERKGRGRGRLLLEQSRLRKTSKVAMKPLPSPVDVKTVKHILADNDIFEDDYIDVKKPDPRVFGFGLPKPKKTADDWTEGDFPALRAQGET
ncbi:hypothetical protein ScPMuIL_004883 [Solemya velum]